MKEERKCSSWPDKQTVYYKTNLVEIVYEEDLAFVSDDAGIRRCQ